MKFFLFASIVLFSLLSKAQTDERIEKIAISTCECVTEKNLEGKSQKEVELQFGFCILGSVSKNKKEFEELYPGKTVLDVDMENFGQQIGIQMAMLCPSIFMNVDLGLDDETTVAAEVELGKIVSIDKKQFNTVNLEIGDGSTLKFLWLWDFEGSEILIKNQFKDKWMNIFYTIIPLYDPEKKTYINYKVIEGIELGE